MNIKKEEANFEQLGLEILDICPNDQPKEFIDGYIEFIAIFFDDIISFYGLVQNFDGTCYIDIESTCDNANRIIKFEASNYSSSSRGIYLRGALLAESNCLRTFIAAFKTDTTKKAA